MDIEQRYERDFITWLERIEKDLHISAQDLKSASWVREVFTTHGELPSARFAHLAFEHRANLTADAVASVTTAARLDTGRDVSLAPYLVPPDEHLPGGSIGVAESDVHACDPVGILVEVADAVQTFVADTYGVVWPVCPDHRSGVHPTRHGSDAVWWCNTGRHMSEFVHSLRR
ncbi:hypothetical protein [Streptomyces sp. NPDC019937]|uniref:hypothetical protein n=1 Tax=Streptomyces sp. NPDC019937 TaxID=3154787 RepID=UPI0033DD7F1C